MYADFSVIIIRTMSSPDLLVIDRLRKENLDQFLTLVRMHLSFVVEISTDDVDGSTEKPKQFRWNFHKKAKGSSISTQNITKTTADVNITEEGMGRVYELIDFLSKEDNVTQEGIFRRTGSLSRQQELRQLLLSGSNLGLDEGRFTVHDCASVLKGILAELPQPLLMDQYYQTYCILAGQYKPTSEPTEPKLLMALQLLLLLLTPLHRNFLQRLLMLLRKAADNEASNRMSPDTLATMFTPHLLCPRKLSPEHFHADSVALAPLISFMIRHSDEIFEAPKQLATDVAAYFTIRERKKMLSPNIDLDESISDRTAANTVFTFVDRGRTRVENESNPTDTALAQLYAHIQALPDSQNKRRLIKQFNRQNGYGTPIQVQRTGKAAGSRSFGDSIKRHIFQKGILNKTPKKGSATTVHTVNEKTNKDKSRPLHDDKPETVTHKNVVLKNLANKMASAECLDDNEDYESDASNESTLSEGALSNRSKKHSPKFVSEPNLSVLDTRTDNETPKIIKKRGNRLFRSKVVSTSQSLSKRYQKRGNAIRGTPTSCVSCFDDQETASDNDNSSPETIGNDKHPLADTPKRSNSKSRIFHDSDEESCQFPVKINYLTSTPGIAEAKVFDEQAGTPYSINFRRASMSPITKSTQKLSKAMQESIMTPRSRKPLIITSEQRDSLPETETKPNDVSKNSDIYLSMSQKNDSDFVSSDDDMVSRSSYVSADVNGSIASGSMNGNTRFIISHDRPDIETKTARILQDTPEGKVALSEPFREYLLSRSVLTATPVDLSILNKSMDTDDKITESLMYCLDGNVPNDLTSSINSLAVDKYNDDNRSPLKDINNVVNSSKNSPNRKRGGSKRDEVAECENKKAMIEKENINEGATYELRETEL